MDRFAADDIHCSVLQYDVISLASLARIYYIKDKVTMNYKESTTYHSTRTLESDFLCSKKLRVRHKTY